MAPIKLSLSSGMGGWWPIGLLALQHSANTLNPRQTMCLSSILCPKNDKPAGEGDAQSPRGWTDHK